MKTELENEKLANEILQALSTMKSEQLRLQFLKMHIRLIQVVQQIEDLKGQISK